MNYIHSSEYNEGKNQLFGNYKEKFELIERYYIYVYTENDYAVQITLSQILGDFLLAQADQKALDKITGKNIEKYALQMIKSENDRTVKKSKWSDYINTVVIFIWLILLVMLLQTFNHNEQTGTSEAMNYFYFGPIEIILVAISFVCEAIRVKLSFFFFFHPKLNHLFRVIFIMPLSIGITCYSRLDRTDSRFSILIPKPVFLILFLVTSVFFIIICIRGGKKTNARKRELLQESDEEFIPEQVLCPSCKREHNYDYPKCPFCGYKAEQNIAQ